jgi:hypothetical protein
MSAQTIRPSRLWYWVAAAAVVASIVCLAVVAVSFVRWLNHETEQFVRSPEKLPQQIDEFQRVPIPGQAEVSFAEPGGYILYFEAPGAGEEGASTPPFTVSIVPAGGGQAVAIHPYGGSLRYSFPPHSGQAVGTFRIDQPGRFVVRAEGAPGAMPANVAVGRSIFDDIALPPPWTVLAAVTLLVGGVVLAVVVTIRRSRARSRQQAPAVQPVAWCAGTTGGDGWFADPSGRYQLRYWDGRKWTELVSDGSTRAADPL